MSRPKRKRRITCYPKANYFKPAGIPIRELKQIILSFEELESVRLKDFLGKDQNEAAEQMGVSQSTFHRMLIAAHKKIAEALVMNKAIRIEGGNFIMEENKSNENKVAISALSGKLEGDIDSRFGRCPFFLLVTIKNGEISNIESIENIHKDMQGGVGTAVAEMVANQEIDAVITGNIGPRALDVLNQFQIAVFKFSGSVNDAIQNFIEKKLIQMR